MIIFFKCWKLSTSLERSFFLIWQKVLLCSQGCCIIFIVNNYFHVVKMCLWTFREHSLSITVPYACLPFNTLDWQHLNLSFFTDLRELHLNLKYISVTARSNWQLLVLQLQSPGWKVAVLKHVIPPCVFFHSKMQLSTSKPLFSWTLAFWG